MVAASQIPEAVIRRLPLYARVLRVLEARQDTVSSRELGDWLGRRPAQVRKDLSYFGRFGKQGRGYNVERLLAELRDILGLTRTWNMALVGVGRLGRAIVDYRGFATEGFEVVACFDASPERVGKKAGKLLVQPMAEMAQTFKEKSIHIGLVAVPANQAQQVIDQLVAAGARGILNYAPMAPKVPLAVLVRYVDPVRYLQSMTFHLKNEKGFGHKASLD